MLKLFFKDSAIYAVPSIISRGMSLFLVPLYTRVLSPSDYGSLDLLMVFAGIVNLTIALEVSQGVARFYAESENLKQKMLYASSAFWFTFFVYLIFAIITFFYSNSLSYQILGKKDLSNVFEIGVVYISINGIFYLIQNQFRWELKSKEYAIVSLVTSIVTAVVSIWLAYYLKYGLAGLLLGMLSGSLVATILGIIWLRNSFQFRFELTYLKNMLIFSSPLVLSGIAVWLSQYIDRIMIKHYLSIEQVGLFGVGYRIASIVGLVMIGFQGALTPLIYNNYTKDDTPEQIAKIFRLFTAASLTFFLMLTLFSIDILKIFTTLNYYNAKSVVIFLVPSFLFANMYIFAPGIGISKKSHYFIWINIIGATINFLLNIFLIPLFGIMGASIATLIGYMSVFMMHMSISQKFYFVPHKWKPIIYCSIISFAMSMILNYFEFSNFIRWFLNVLSLIIFLFSILVFDLININELQKLKLFLKLKKNLK
jgi:O-antigen/teichoic acid export membrane protein